MFNLGANKTAFNERDLQQTQQSPFHAHLQQQHRKAPRLQNNILKGNSCPVRTARGSSNADGQYVGVRQTQRQAGKQSAYSHGSLLMNCGPGLCWEGGGLGVPTSLFLAILVLALANSSRRVWGISGSNRTP